MKTTKQKLTALAAAVSVFLSAALFSACGVESPADGKATPNDPAPNSPVVEDIFDDSIAQPAEDINPNTDPDTNPDANPDTDPDGLSVITDAVVVSAHHNQGSDRVIFQCAAILVGYPGGYSPFEFGVPAGSIEFKADEVPFEELEGKLVNIEFDGAFLETYPLGVSGVTKVIYSGSLAEQGEFAECKAVYSIFDFDEEPESCIKEMYIADNAYVVKTEELWDGERAVILAYAQMGPCGLKDLVEIVIPKNDIKDENGEIVSVSDIEVGRCIEFDFSDVGSKAGGSPVFTVEGISYLTVKSESVEVSEETVKAALDAYTIE